MHNILLDRTALSSVSSGAKVIIIIIIIPWRFNIISSSTNRNYNF